MKSTIKLFAVALLSLIIGGSIATVSSASPPVEPVLCTCVLVKENLAQSHYDVIKKETVYHEMDVTWFYNTDCVGRVVPIADELNKLANELDQDIQWSVYKQ